MYLQHSNPHSTRKNMTYVCFKVMNRKSNEYWSCFRVNKQLKEIRNHNLNMFHYQIFMSKIYKEFRNTQNDN